MPVSGEHTPFRLDGRWLLVALGFLALALSFSVRAILGLAMPAMEAEFAQSRAFFSGVGAVALLVMAAAAPVAGCIVDQRGPHILIVGGLVAIAVGAAVAAVTSSAYLFALAFASVAALGFTAIGTNVVAAAIAKRFTDRRGLATGIGTAGATAGQLAVVPLVAALMQAASWRWGFAVLAGAAACLAVVAIAAWTSFAEPRPSQRSVKEDERTSAIAGAGDLLRQPAFHLLFWSFLICGFTTTGVIETHFLPYAAFCGFPPLPSATAYGVLCLLNLFGMVGAGWLADRVHRPRLLSAIYVGRALTFVLLLQLAAATPDLRMLYVFAALFGIVDYATVPITVSLAASHLGTARLGLAVGLISSGHALGGAMGAFLGGALFDGLGRYAELWSTSLVLSGLAGLAILLLPNRPSDHRSTLPPLAPTAASEPA